MSLERELYAIFQRFVYSSVFLHFRRNLEKYNQWKPFFISLVFLALLDSVVLFLCAILLPTMFVGSFTISIVIFLFYWYFRIEKFKKIGNTKNSKYWDEAQFWLGLSGLQFEQEVADVFRRNGFKAEVTPASGDGGVDIIMHKDNLKYIIQCKKYANHPVTPQELRALWGVKDDFSADRILMVTTSTLTKMGKQFLSNKPNFSFLTLNDLIYLSQKPLQNNNSNKNLNP